MRNARCGGWPSDRAAWCVSGQFATLLGGFARVVGAAMGVALTAGWCGVDRRDGVGRAVLLLQGHEDGRLVHAEDG